MKYRVAIQKHDGNRPRYFRNVMLESELDIETIQRRIKRRLPSRRGDKYLIAVQGFDRASKPNEFRNVVVHTRLGIDQVQRTVISLFPDAYQSWLDEWMRVLAQRYTRKIFRETHGLGTDLFDSEAVGHDISEEEFVRNEIDFELMEGRH